MTLTRTKSHRDAGHSALRIAAIALGAASLSACAYGVGDYGGYGGVSIGVGSGGYAGAYDPYCDGYAAWDGFYGCDAGYGFGQIGFGGGYWDNFYYPGYGTWIYDRPGGRRFAMQDRHRQYWGRQRWQYQQQRRGDRRDARQDFRQDRRDDRRETLQDRREWRQERREGSDEFPRTRRGERERMGGLTPEDRQRRLERWEQRQQEATGQPGVRPGAGREGRRGWQDGDGRGRGGEGRQRPAISPPGPGAAAGRAPVPRAERAPRPDRAPRVETAPRSGRNGETNPSGVRTSDVRED